MEKRTTYVAVGRGLRGVLYTTPLPIRKSIKLLRSKTACFYGLVHLFLFTLCWQKKGTQGKMIGQ